MRWVISNINAPSMRWSNEFGWTNWGYDVFSDEEKRNLSLPLYGMWEPAPWEDVRDDLVRRQILPDDGPPVWVAWGIIVMITVVSWVVVAAITYVLLNG